MSIKTNDRESISEAAKDLITNGTIILLQKQPFYASLVLQTDIQECWDIETADIDGKTMRYSPEFILQQNPKKVAGLLAHEVMHVAKMHHLRRGNRDPERWNIACDLVINPIILDADMELPDGGLLDRKYQDMCAEEVYEELPKTKKKKPAVGIGDVRDAPEGESKAEEGEQEVRAKVVQAAIDARLKGELPLSIQRLIAEVLREKVDWRQALARFVSMLSKNDYTFLKPSVRYLWRGLYLPSLESLETGKIILILDTSGSIDDKMISQFSSEISAIAGIFNIPLLVIYVDKEVQAVQEFDAGEEILLKPAGGGGTSFKPGFEYISKNNLCPRAVVYLTDGCCNDYPPQPEYPTLWAQFGSWHFEPPFGEKLQIL